MRGILFDLDGVIYQGESLIEGAADALAWVRARQIPHLFVTNTSSRPREALCRKLRGMGIEAGPQTIVSPPAAAARWLGREVEGPVALFVPEVTRSEFAALALWSGAADQRVGAVVIGDLGEGWTFQRLNQAFRLLMANPAPRLVALGMTRYWRAGSDLQLDAGPFVSALQYATGLEPVVLGKPARAFFAAAADQLEMEPGELLMIGDDIRGDIQGAQRAGLRAALVKTGKFQPQDLESAVHPDAVLESVASLPAWWRNQADRQHGA
jgi:phospholysine phosphohistidine inorganic pyrophosphate phosphatase